MNNRVLGQVFFAISLMIVVFLALNLVIRPKKDYVLRFRPADVMGFSLRSERGDVFLQRIPNSSGEWGVGKDSQHLKAADARTIEVLLAVLARMEYVEKFDLKDLSQGTDKAQLKLGDTAEVKLHLRSGGELFLRMGRETPSGTEYYVASSQKPEMVYTVQNRYHTILLRSDTDLASRQLIPITSQVTAIAFEMGGRTVHFHRSGKGWASDTSKISGERATEIVHMVRKLSFTNYFEKQKEDDLSRYGLTVPDFEISVTAGPAVTTRYSVSFYSRQFYLRSSVSQDVFIVAPDTALPLFKILHEIIP